MADSEVTGVYDTATVNAVRAFQEANIRAYSDTPQFSGDNWKAYLILGQVGRVTWSWIKAVNMSEQTVPIPPIRPNLNPDDLRMADPLRDFSGDLTNIDYSAIADLYEDD